MKNKPDSLTCKNCGGHAKSVISGTSNGAGFLLRGSGWAFDRYAGPSNFHFPGDKKSE